MGGKKGGTTGGTVGVTGTVGVLSVCGWSVHGQGRRVVNSTGVELYEREVLDVPSGVRSNLGQESTGE